MDLEKPHEQGQSLDEQPEPLVEKLLRRLHKAEFSPGACAGELLAIE